MQKALTFISAAVIERLAQGRFVPTRRADAGQKADERRNVISPLAITKRCIRYEPNVFHHRKDMILDMAATLNNSAQKIMLVGGPQGVGKTSLVRGLIELMGSKNEQLLWYDVNRHTDFEEIIQFLIQYITYVCAPPEEQRASAFTLERRADRSRPRSGDVEEPLRRLEALLGCVSDMPLLLVLDNVEFIVDSELRFNSYPFKEMLNFLLAFPNIKMVLIGERLPYADMTPSQEGVADFQLAGLTETNTLDFLQRRMKSSETGGPDPAILEQLAAPEAELAALRHLYPKTHGHPWLLRILSQLHQHGRMDFYTQNRLLESQADGEKTAGLTQSAAALIHLVLARLPDQQRQVLHVLCFLRHPVNAKTLQALVGVCYPTLGPSRLDAHTLGDMLEQVLVRPLLKISYPPQEVLAHVRQRRKDGGEGKYKPWYELYHVVKRTLYQALPVEERTRIHAALQDVYLQEKTQDAESRTLRIKNRALLSEAKFHASAARGRKSARPAPDAAMVDWPDGGLSPGVTSKAYLYQHVKPKSAQQRFTLDDYRSIRLPESLMGDEAETSLEGPTILELMGQASEPDVEEPAEETPSFQRMLSELELSEEEKDLVYSHEDPPVPKALPAQSSAPLPPQAPEPSGVPAPDLHSLPDELMTANQTDEQERQIQQRLATAAASHDKPLMVRELLSLARYRAGRGRYAGAGQCLEKALGLNAWAGKEVLAELYRLSGFVNKETYHHNAAVASLLKAAAYIKRLMYEDDTVDAAWMGRLGEVYQNLGEIHAYRSQHKQAIEHFQQALRWFGSTDDEVRQSEVYFQLAGAYEDLGDIGNALAHYETALLMDETHGHKQSAASALANLGNLHETTGNVDEALDCFQRSLAYDRETGNLEGQLNTLERIANLQIAQEAWPQADQVAQQGLALAVQEGVSLWQALFYMKLGQVAELQKNWEAALRQYERARSSGDRELARESLSWIEQKIAEAEKFVRG